MGENKERKLMPISTKEKKITFIDSSINNVGWATFRVEGEELIEHGFIDSKKCTISDDCNNKSYQLAEQVYTVINDKSDIFWIEEPPPTLYENKRIPPNRRNAYMKARAQSLFKTFAAIYSMATLLRLNGKTVCMANPSHWQWEKTGPKQRFKDPKALTKHYAELISCKVIDNEHVADAIVFGWQICQKINEGIYTVNSTPSVI